MITKHFSQTISVFHGRTPPERGKLVGYGAVIDSMQLSVPIPERLAIVSEIRRQYNNESWLVFTPRHEPKDTL